MKTIQSIRAWLTRLFQHHTQLENQRKLIKKEWSDAQLRHREIFAEAARFARSQIADPQWRRFYEHRSKPGVTAYCTAVAMYVRHFTSGSDK